MAQKHAAASPQAAARPYPDPVSPLFAGYLDGLARRQLVIRECTACGTRQWPPRALCGVAGALTAGPAQLPGAKLGLVTSYGEMSAGSLLVLHSD